MFAIVSKERHTKQMGIYKAVKLEIMVLTEAGMSDEEIIRWTNDALKDYADFLEVTTKITEKHESVMANFGDEAKA